jgi:hypothetical protein
MILSKRDKTELRELAKRWREVAGDPVMAERKKLWRDLHDLKPQRPVILYETRHLLNYLGDYEFRCESAFARAVETRMIHVFRQYDELGTDIVVEPYFRLGWQGHNMWSTGTEFGDIKIVEQKAEEGGMAFKSEFPVKIPDDIKRMRKRNFKVDRKTVPEARDLLADAFGGELPVRLGNFDNMDKDLGNQPFCGNFFIGVTWDVFKLIGPENMLTWPYEEPDALRELLAFLVDDKKRFFTYMQEEGLLCSNTDNQFAGPSSYGYVSDLGAGRTEGVKLDELWTWADSQETEMFSPEMFADFFLPCIAELANMFGLVYYGCCERLDHKFSRVVKAIPGVRCVSTSKWTDVDSLAEQMGANYVMSRKPNPIYVSSPTAEVEWDKIAKEAETTARAVKKNNTPIEIVFRDAYSPVVTNDRVKKWISIWKEKLDLA